MPNLIIRCTPSSPTATAEWHGQTYPALIGKNGPIAATLKCEGDGCTPLGKLPLLMGFYRDDRIQKPITTIPMRAIQKGDCFCDDVASPFYNTFIPADHPDAARFGQTGTLWKEGAEYDVLFSLGYNTHPVVPGKGSAILLHGWREGATHSGGCVVLPNTVLQRLAGEFKVGDGVEIRAG